MWWKFWKWGKKKTGNDTAPELVTAEESGGPDPMAPKWPGAAGVREVLALQQLVGNQAVLAMLAQRSLAAKGRDHGT